MKIFGRKNNKPAAQAADDTPKVYELWFNRMPASMPFDFIGRYDTRTAAEAAQRSITGATTIREYAR
jgi:hypothetical protein